MEKKRNAKNERGREEDKHPIIDLHYRVINAQHPHLILDDLIVQNPFHDSVCRISLSGLYKTVS